MKYITVRRICGALIVPLVIASALTGCSSEAPVAKPKLGDLEKSLFMINTDYSAVVRYPNYLGEARFSDPVTVTYRCTGWAVGDSGEIMTAGHCAEFGLDQKIAILKEALAQPKLGVNENEVGSWVEEALDSPNWAFLGIGAGDNEPDMVVRVFQNPEVDGSVITNVASPPIARVIAREPFDNGDLTLLKVDNLSKPTVPLTVASTPPEIGDGMTSIGYPGNIMDMADRSREHATFSDGTIQSNQTIGGVGSQQVSTNLQGGMSGGPTINKNFEVVGVNSFGLRGSETISFITNSGALVEFLQSHGIEVKLPPPPPEKKDNTMLIIAIAVGSIVVLALVTGGVVLLVKRSKKASPATPVPGSGKPLVQELAEYPPMPQTTIPVAAVDVANGLKTCASCSSPLLPGVKFCGGCGSPQTVDEVVPPLN